MGNGVHGAGHIGMLRVGGSFLERTKLVLPREFLLVLTREVERSFSTVFATMGTLVSARSDDQHILNVTVGLRSSVERVAGWAYCVGDKGKT